MPLARGWRIYDEAIRNGSGLARRTRYVMSHTTGKIEICGFDGDRIRMRYHQARDSELISQQMTAHCPARAGWFDEQRRRIASGNELGRHTSHGGRRARLKGRIQVRMGGPATDPARPAGIRPPTPRHHTHSVRSQPPGRQATGPVRTTSRTAQGKRIDEMLGIDRWARRKRTRGNSPLSCTPVAGRDRPRLHPIFRSPQ